MNEIRSQIKFSWRLFIHRTVSIRVFSLLLLLGFVYHIFLAPLNNYVKSVQYPVCPYIFPFLLSDIYFLILFMAAVVYYYSDAPFMKNWTMYQVVRIGRVRWAMGQIGAIVLSSFIFVLIAIGMTGVLLVPNVTLNEGWGKVLYTLSMTGAPGGLDIPFSVPYEIISHYTVGEAVGVTILISGMVITFMGLLMFCTSLVASRLWANVLAMLFVILPMAQKNIGMAVPQLAYFSPVSWMQLSELKIGENSISPSMSYCIAVLGIMCILFSLVIIWKIRTVDFQMVKED